jgi:hypothetical protein
VVRRWRHAHSLRTVPRLGRFLLLWPPGTTSAATPAANPLYGRQVMHAIMLQGGWLAMHLFTQHCSPLHRLLALGSALIEG